MSGFDDFKQTMSEYLESNGYDLSIISNLHDTSVNDADPKKIVYLYNGKKDLEVIDMDLIAKQAYRDIKRAAQISNNFINTADAFVINQDNKWYFIEFKDAVIKSDNDKLKSNVLKKAYSNWYMVLDVLYSMKAQGKLYLDFEYDDPIQFAKKNVYYILVCSEDKNPNTYIQIKNYDLIGEKYTPVFMQRLKDYLFKDAYVYTEKFLERKLVERFIY